MAVIAEQLRRLGSAIPHLGRESHKPPFDERWQNAPYDASEIDGASFVYREISDLMSRMRKNRTHFEAAFPTVGIGFQTVPVGERKIYRMDVSDLAEQPLTEELKNPLLAHLEDRQANSEGWRGEPVVGVTLFTDRFMGHRSVAIELTVDTVDPSDRLVWVDRGRQGVSVVVSDIVVANADWDWVPIGKPEGPNLEAVLQYVRSKPPFQIARELCRVAENVIESPKQPGN